MKVFSCFVYSLNRSIGFYYGDPILAAALWRNLFICREDTSFHQIASSLEYVRKNLLHLDQSSTDDILNADFKFLNVKP